MRQKQPLHPFLQHATRLSVCLFALSGCSSALESPSEFEDSAEFANDAEFANEGDIPDATQQIGTVEHALTHPNDKRQDVFDATDRNLAALARKSTAIQMGADKIIMPTTGNAVAFRSTPLGGQSNLCSTERFLSDPVVTSNAVFPIDDPRNVPTCNATLISDDLVLTAAHCVGHNTCASTRYVFGYYRQDSATMNPVVSEDVFSCSEVVVRSGSSGFGLGAGTGVDEFNNYAIVRLNRKATPRYTPAPLTRTNPVLGVGSSQGVIGSGTGIPLKVDTGVTVRGIRIPGQDYYDINTLTYHGTAGSAVYRRSDYGLSGIINPAKPEYQPRSRTTPSCNEVRVCSSSSGCSGESVTYVDNILRGLCSVIPNHALCTDVQSFSFTGFDTNNALRNTRNRWVFLSQNQVLSAGTCNVPGGSGTGDTLLRLVDSDGQEVANNDDSCGLLSHINFQATRSGLYELRAGCYGQGVCTGTVGIAITTPAVTPPVVPSGSTLFSGTCAYYTCEGESRQCSSLGGIGQQSGDFFTCIAR